MPRAKPKSPSETAVTHTEEGRLNADAFPTPDSNQENVGASKKKGARSKANARRFTKPKRSSGSSFASRTTAAAKAKAGRRRPPLKEPSNKGDADETEEVDEFVAQTEAEGEALVDELDEPKPGRKRKAPERKTGLRDKAQRTEHVNSMEKDGEFEYTPTAIRQHKARKTTNATKGRVPRPQASAEPEQEKIVQETQIPIEIETPLLQEEEDPYEEVIPQSVFRRSNHARTASRQRQPPVARMRAGSASSTERGEPNLRRRLGDMTRKFDNLDLKYRNLREIASKEAETNFEKLKAHSEAKAKAANDLITSLKKEIVTQKAIAQESHSIRKQLESRDSDLSKTQALADQLSTSLAQAQNENKALQAKLANSRSVPTAVESLGTKTPGSAIKGKSQAQTRTTVVGSGEAAHAAQVAQLKEDLYSDLTGLILRGVNIGSHADTYDCIQTGRNGTLHFNLAVAKETDDTYENTEFQYTPRLDGNRDRDLTGLLPEYLTDEIIFSRANAAMFYGRVVETVTKKRSAEAQD